MGMKTVIYKWQVWQPHPKWNWKKQRHKKDYRQSTGYRRKTKEIKYILIDISEKESRTDGAEIISVI